MGEPGGTMIPLNEVLIQIQSSTLLDPFGETV